MSLLRYVAEALDDGQRSSSRPTFDELLDVAARSMGAMRGTVYVVDCRQGRIVCSLSPGGAVDVRPLGRWEKAVVAAARHAVGRANDNGVGPPPPSRLRGATIASAVPLGGSLTTTTARYAAVQVGRADNDNREHGKLSPRELQVARLLAEGYSSVNIAAQYGVSTNTVRTLTQRLYRKLGVFNRAELVQEMLRPSPLSVNGNR